MAQGDTLSPEFLEDLRRRVGEARRGLSQSRGVRGLSNIRQDIEQAQPNRERLEDLAKFLSDRERAALGIFAIRRADAKERRQRAGAREDRRIDIAEDRLGLERELGQEGLRLQEKGIDVRKLLGLRDIDLRRDLGERGLDIDQQRVGVAQEAQDFDVSKFLTNLRFFSEQLGGKKETSAEQRALINQIPGMVPTGPNAPRVSTLDEFERHEDRQLADRISKQVQELREKESNQLDLTDFFNRVLGERTRKRQRR